MKQKMIIGFSVILIMLAVFLIARDLFRNSSSLTGAACCGDDYTGLKQMDTALIGYRRIRIIETGLKDLSGIAIDDRFRIFVCGNQQVAVFDTTGIRTGGFKIDTIASCIALSGSDLYIGIGPRVSNYSYEGVKSADFKAYNSEGYITSVSKNGDFVYAADAINKIVLKYTNDGTLIQEIGRKDSLTGSSGFVLPSLYFDIAFGSFNDLWVVNTGMLRLENFTTSGNLQSVWETASPGNNGFIGCCNPVHIAILPNGSFVTYEKGIDMIKVFDPTGQLHCLVAGAGSFKGNADYLLGNNNLVKDLVTDTNGHIYILDAYNRINIFADKDI
jgi:hypothetical protein